MNKQRLVQRTAAAIEQIESCLETGEKTDLREALLKIRDELRRRLLHLQREEGSADFEMQPYGGAIVDSWDHDCSLGEGLLCVEQEMEKYINKKRKAKNAEIIR